MPCAVGPRGVRFLLTHSLLSTPSTIRRQPPFVAFACVRLASQIAMIGRIRERETACFASREQQRVKREHALITLSTPLFVRRSSVLDRSLQRRGRLRRARQAHTEILRLTDCDDVSDAQAVTVTSVCVAKAGYVADHTAIRSARSRYERNRSRPQCQGNPCPNSDADAKNS